MEGFPFHALGMDPSISPRLNKLEVNEGDVVLMLTDGVFGAISALEIFSILKKMSSPLSKALKMLWLLPMIAEIRTIKLWLL